MKDGYCGLFCGACLCNIAHESGNVEDYARKTNRTVEQLTCTTCKTEKHEDCCFVSCCLAKGLNSCSECDEMPCKALQDFANDDIFYHATTIPNLQRMREIGMEAWEQEQTIQFSCPACGARTGWRLTVCEKCGSGGE